MIDVRVQADDFDPGAEIERLHAGRGDIGAVASFTGLVRGGDIVAMTLEHYPGMTERQLRAIADDAATRWPLDGIVIVHRHGRLLPGERIVLVAVASSHRAAAFEACAFLMDWLKTQAPFWKREESDEGDRWVEAKVSDDAAAARWQR
ncbi:molybdenum cofactor biosynthesis protein MoaE [Sphingoaurantiacus capsulatus]|uniref:Molybdopterin synthase catalytic subunit n=1 Tax=Sphingoaurantiacus capsulatus TaxID=1771310 RepID=A0ABV7XBB0_9SPHN